MLPAIMPVPVALLRALRIGRALRLATSLAGTVIASQRGNPVMTMELRVSNEIATSHRHLAMTNWVQLSSPLRLPVPMDPCPERARVGEPIASALRWGETTPRRRVLPAVGSKSLICGVWPRGVSAVPSSGLSARSVAFRDHPRWDRYHERNAAIADGQQTRSRERDRPAARDDRPGIRQPCLQRRRAGQSTGNASLRAEAGSVR